MNVQLFRQTADQIIHLTAREADLAHKVANAHGYFTPLAISAIKQQLKTTRQQLVVAKQNLLVML